MTWIKFNLNQNVRVKLTPLGRRIHYEDWLRVNQAHPSVFLTYRPVVEDADGWSTWQCYHLMHLYGPYQTIGSPNVFELNIELDPKS
jgi:hypothetical protein